MISPPLLPTSPNQWEVQGPAVELLAEYRFGEAPPDAEANREKEAKRKTEREAEKDGPRRWSRKDRPPRATPKPPPPAPRSLSPLQKWPPGILDIEWDACLCGKGATLNLYSLIEMPAAKYGVCSPFSCFQTIPWLTLAATPPPGVGWCFSSKVTDWCWGWRLLLGEGGGAGRVLKSPYFGRAFI